VRCEAGGTRKEEGGRRKEEGGRRKEEGGKGEGREKAAGSGGTAETGVPVAAGVRREEHRDCRDCRDGRDCGCCRARGEKGVYTGEARAS